MKVAVIAIVTLFAVAIGLPVKPCAEDKTQFKSGDVLPKSVPVAKPAGAPTLSKGPTTFSSPQQKAQTWNKNFKPQTVQNNGPGWAPTSTPQRVPTTGTSGNMAPVPTTPSPAPTQSPIPGSSISLPNVNASARGNTTLSIGAQAGAAAMAANTEDNNTAIVGTVSATGGASGIVTPIQSLIGLQNAIPTPVF